MEILSIYWRTTWCDAIRNLNGLDDHNSIEEVAAYERQMDEGPRLIYSVSAAKWVKCYHMPKASIN